MRPSIFLLALAVAAPAAAVVRPNPAEAAPSAKAKGPRHGKKPKKGRGNKNGKKQITTIEGAGQRLHFSFAARLKHDVERDKLTGSFTLVVHPLAPPGDILNVVCRFGELTSPEHAGDTFEFDAKGVCKQMHLDGRITSVTARNHITIVDNPGGDDAIDVDFIGASGVAVPGGALSYGGFTVSAPPPALHAG